MIRLEHVTKRYAGGSIAVDDLSLEVAEGETCVLVGPSGCGKSTTLRMINRLIEPTSGRIEVAGRDIARIDAVELRRGIGYVIQQVGLFPHHTVAANVATVPRLLGWDRTRTARRVDELLALVGLDPAEFGRRYPAQLSGGQRQRVGVARALAADPPVLLMDEPFGAVDPIVRIRLQDEFRRLQGALRKTVVFVTHDLDEAIRVGDRIAVLADGGVLAQHGPPADVVGRPATAFVSEFVGTDRVLRHLAALPVRSLVLGVLPAQGAEKLARVDAGATLRDALAVLLPTAGGMAAVVEDGRLLGVVTLEDVRAAAGSVPGTPDHGTP